MNIGILTFHQAINFGAVLQAYGLQEALRQKGHSAAIIDYSPYWVTRKRGGLLFNAKQAVKSLLRYPISNTRAKRFGEFGRKYLNVRSLDLQQTSNDYDAFILGSDQIWNPRITANHFDANYFGQFPAAQDKLTIGYAGSVGAISNLTAGADLSAEFIALTGKMNAVSARETELNDFLNTHGVRSELVLDPVLLAGRQCFDTILPPPPKATEPYLLLFQIDYNPKVVALAHHIASQLGLKVKEIIPQEIILSKPWANQCVSPTDLVSLVRSAAYVVSGSFHATAFSLLYHRPVTVYENKERSNRMHHLLSIAGMTERLTNDADVRPTKEELMRAIDCATVDANLEAARRTSMQFLQNALTQ